MKLVQQTGVLEPQFREILDNGIDKRVFADVTSGSADAEFTIEHGAGTIPLGYIVISQDKPGIIYSSATPWDESHIFLKSTVSGVVLRVLIF
jgi:hypothetical protein